MPQARTSKQRRTKICTKCGKRKKLANFHRRAKASDGRRPECAKCGCLQSVSYYSRHQKARISATQDRRRAALDWIRELRETSGCTICDESDPACLDYHHRNPKNKHLSIAEMVRQGYSRERILKEIRKCDVVCANCHRKLHDHRRL